MTDKVRIVVAGAGAFGREHLRILSEIDGVVIAGVADTNQAAAQQAAARWGAGDWGSDAGDLADRLRPDGLIVATPGQTHVALAVQALRCGIPVLIEKPVGVSSAEVARLIEEEAASTAFVLPGHILRFSPAHRTFADIARSEVGRILTLTARRHRDDSHAVRYTDIDPILMTMIHDVDLAVWITRAEAAAAFALRCPPTMQRSATTLTVSDTAGAAWHLSTAWTLPSEAPPDRIEVVGEQGAVELEVGSHIRHHGRTTRTIDIRSESPDEALRAELSTFVDCIRLGSAPALVSTREALAGLVVAEAALASLRSGGLVSATGR